MQRPVQQMRDGVMALDGVAPLLAHFDSNWLTSRGDEAFPKVTKLTVVLRTQLEKEGVASLDGVNNRQRIRTADNDASISNLAAHFSVERRIIYDSKIGRTTFCKVIRFDCEEPSIDFKLIVSDESCGRVIATRFVGYD